MPTRRKAINLIATSAVAAVVPASAKAEMQELSVNEPIAMALGYQPIAEDVDTTRFPKRAGAEGAKQFCYNCSLYKAQTDQLGTCSAIPNKLVAGPGWCNAWVPAN